MFNWPQFTFATYDSVNGCQPVDLNAPSYAALRWYNFAWTICTYPVPLVCSIVLNTAAILHLRVKSDSLNGGFNESGGRGLETLAKRRAAIGLQRASIAFAFIFGFTSAPFQYFLALETLTGL